MNYVEYRDEEVREEIFEGTYILDGLSLTEEQQREKIFDLMRQAGIEIGDESKLEIGYEGADDDYGVSETQSTKFVVTRIIKKKVPYRVTKEEVFEGTFILDGLRLTEEQQREKIYNLMVQAGVSIDKKEFDTYEIGYDGADDDYGISETQSTKFVVYKVKRERIDTSNIVSSKDDLSQVLTEIKSLRDKLNSIINDVSRVDIIQELVDKTEGLEKMVSNNHKASSNVYTEAMKEIDEELLRIEKLLKDAIKSYEESYEQMRKILEEQNEKLNSSGLLTDEEYNELMREFLDKKIEENERTIAIKKEIDSRKKQIASLKKRKNKIKKDLMSAEALGINASQYQNITNTLLKRKIVNAIFEAKGLDEIIAIPYKERTKEQKNKLKDAKEQIIEEIAKLQKENEGISVLDAIEALYGIDTEMVMNGKVKEYKVTKKELDKIKENVALLPEKIVVKDKNLVNNKVLNSINPTDAPEDMLDVYDKKAQEVVEEIKENEVKNNILEELQQEKVVEKEDKFKEFSEDKPMEVISLFIDEENLDVYARKYVFDRFHLEKQSGETIIDGSVCYKLDEEDADYIIDNKDNNYSPYIIETRQLAIDKENANDKKVTEKITLYIDVDNNNEIYGNRYLFSRFNMDILSDEIRIDGKACFRMSQEDATFILGNQENNYSPYVVETRKIQLGKREVKHEELNTPIEKVTLYIDTDNNNEVYGNRYLFGRFNVIPLSREVRIDGKVCFRMDENDAAFILGNKDNNYSPYVVEIREVHLGKRNTNTNTNLENKQYIKDFENINSIKREKDDENLNNKEINNNIKNVIKEELPVERIVLYRDMDNSGEIYGKKYLFDRFNMDYSNSEVRIEGALCYRIEDEDLDFIVGNQNNNYSPYRIEVREVHLGKKEEKEEVVENTTQDYPVEKMTLYRDLDNGGIVYGKKYLFDRFNLDYYGDGVRIDGALCYQIDFDDADFILGNQNNNYSPYTVEIIDTQLGKKNVSDLDENIDNIIINTPEVVEDSNLNDDINKDDFMDITRVDLPPIVEAQPVVEENFETNEEVSNKEENDNNGVVTHTDDTKVEETKDDIVNDTLVEEVPTQEVPVDETPVEEVPIQEVPVDETPVEEVVEDTPKSVKPHVEEILDSLTKGLDIGPRDSSRYMASNIHVSDNFKRELSTGNVAYNVVHFVPGVLRASVGLVRKLSAKLLLSGRGKDAMMQLEDRLEDLSEEELEVLFEEYKGSQLKTDMNNQINPIILDRLRRYGLEKVAVLNNNIKINYTELFVLLGQIRSLEEKVDSNNLTDEEISILTIENNKLMKQAAELVIKIKDDRKKANDLLSGGVHGLEEDFKAVVSKLNYIGFRFAKTNAFDNELQHKLGQYGQGLNVAIANNDYAGIVTNFMNLESLYFENTEIKGNALTRRSIGSKYYTPLAEQFDYRDDPFVRDLLSTVAITSATVSAINAVRVHQVETAEINNNIHAANQYNQATMNQVHNIGEDITSRRDEFIGGMEAQAHADVLGVSNTIERAELDMHDWKFTDAYHAADRVGHGFYNRFNDEVTSQINSVASRYSRGIITQDAALREMTNIANSSHATLVDVSHQCLSILRNYAANHPEFDFRAVEESMSFLVNHPDVVANMNSSMVDVVSLGEALKGLTTEQYRGLVSLPSDMLSTLICACSAATLATNVASDMDKRHNGKLTFGTDMMYDFLKQGNEDENIRGHRR